MTINIEMKNPLSRKMVLSVSGYTNGEYLYMRKVRKMSLIHEKKKKLR